MFRNIISLGRLPTRSLSTLTEPTTKTPSRIRAVFFGFLGGMAVSSASGYLFISDQVNDMNAAMRADLKRISQSVTQLQDNTDKVEALLREVEKLKSDTAKKTDFSELQEQVTKEKADLNIALAEHKHDIHTAQAQIFEDMKYIRYLAER
eukprot:m.336703 g.336703  ORF g.336703 m.336703 type:complete len:150 (+) comp17937_c0_seq1:123-572(+)